jgi:hypothetical protein
MEDAHLCFDDAQLKALYEPPTGQEVPAGQPGVNHAKILSSALRLGLYGVLDGHGGRQVADLVAKVLPRYLVKELAALPSLPSPLANEVVGCCERAVAAADAESQQAARQNGWTDGCCCVLLLLVNDSCFVCNMGDSKAVLCRRRKVLIDVWWRTFLLVGLHCHYVFEFRYESPCALIYRISLSCLLVLLFFLFVLCRLELFYLLNLTLAQ